MTRESDIPVLAWDFQPFAGSLVVMPCVSPLTKSKSAGSQQELF